MTQLSGTTTNGDASVKSTQLIERAWGVSNRLENLLGETDGKFVELGNAAQDALKNSQNFLELAGQDGLAANEDSKSDYLADIRQLFAKLQSEFHLKRENVSSRHRSIMSIRRLLPELIRGFNQIQEVGNQLQILGTDFAIQVVKSDSAVLMFGDYSKELKSFAVEILDSTSTLLDEAHYLYQRIRQLDKRIALSITRIDVLLKQMDEDVTAASQQLDQMLQNANVRLNDVKLHSQGFDVQVSEIVVALQFHDIVRQKVEHVYEALNELKREDAISRISAIVELQSRQLSAVVKEINEADTSLNRSFDGIGARIESLANALRSTGLRSDVSALGHLRKALIHLVRNFEEASDIEKTIGSTLKEGMEAGERLSGRVMQVATISDNVKLQALNAIIMANQLQEGGRTLSVLASQVKELSITSDALVEKVVDNLNELSTRSAALADDSQTDNSGGPDMSGEIHHVMDRIAGAYGDVQRRNETMESVLQQVEMAIAQSQHKASVVTQLMNEFRISGQDLSNLVSRAQITARFSGEGEGFDLSDHMARYTMASERDVHEGKQAEGDKPDDDVADAGQTDDDELGDFELF